MGSNSEIIIEVWTDEIRLHLTLFSPSLVLVSRIISSSLTKEHRNKVPKGILTISGYYLLLASALLGQELFAGPLSKVIFSFYCKIVFRGISFDLIFFSF